MGFGAANIQSQKEKIMKMVKTEGIWWWLSVINLVRTHWLTCTIHQIHHWWCSLINGRIWFRNLHYQGRDGLSRVIMVRRWKFNYRWSGFQISLYISSLASNISSISAFPAFRKRLEHHLYWVPSLVFPRHTLTSCFVMSPHPKCNWSRTYPAA